MNDWNTQFMAFRNSYHGDTAGAASLGAATMFQIGSTRWNFPAMQIPNIRALEALEPAEIAKIAAVVIGAAYPGSRGDAFVAPRHAENCSRMVQSDRHPIDC